MRVIASAYDQPKEVPISSDNQLQQGFKCVRSKDSTDRFIADWAYDVCKRMLDTHHISADEIGLIISISISPDNLVQEASVAAPRLCHPLQRALKANKAFVFDLLDSDWATAIQIAKGFSISQEYKYVLIVRAEKMRTSILPDNESGFDIPDGVGVLLLSLAENTSKAAQYTYVNYGSEHASLHFLEREEIQQSGYKACFTWPYSPNTILDMNNLIPFIIDGHIQGDSDPDYIVAESWFPQHQQNIASSSKGILSQAKNSLALGPFTIPYFIGEINKIRADETVHKNILAITFNPFLMRYSSISLTV